MNIPIFNSLLKIQFYQVVVRKFTSTMLAPPTSVRERTQRRSELRNLRIITEDMDEILEYLNACLHGII